MSEFNFKRTWGPQPNFPLTLAYNRPKAEDLILIAGPCSIEDPDQVQEVALELARVGVTFMRGGVYRAGTYPPINFGLQRPLLRTWFEIARMHGLKTIVEVLDIRQIEAIEPYADAFQVGARHMQDYSLLKELAQFERTVTLKRHPGSTVDEFLGACEYLLQGRCKPILIERGSSSIMRHVRWDLSVSTIAAIKELTNVPIIVDASHGSGRRDLVRPLTLAGIAAGADGLLVEVHPRPGDSLSDADQAYPLGDFEQLIEKAKKVKGAIQ